MLSKAQKAWLKKQMERRWAELSAEVREAIRKEMKAFHDTPVVLEGRWIQVKTTLGGWLTLFTKAHEAGWQPQTTNVAPEGQTVKADEARQFAAALAKVDFEGRDMILLSGAARLVALAGEFRVYEGA
jgi:hypothetical protein